MNAVSPQELPSPSNPFLVRLRIDLSPAFFGFLAFWGVGDYCDVLTGGEWLWPVVSANVVAGWTIASWWIFSDAVRRRCPLLPVWGILLTSVGSAALVAYLFHSRGAWAWFTMLLYGVLTGITSVLVRLMAW